MHPHRFRALMLSVVLAIGLYGVVVVWADPDALAQAFMRLSLENWAVLLGLSLVNYLLRFFRWVAYLVRMGHRPPLGLHFLVYMGGFAFTATPGKAGEAVRAVYLKHLHVPYSASLAALFAERLQDMLVVLMLGALVLLSLPDYEFVFYAGGALTVVAVVALQSQALQRLFQRWWDAFSPQKLRPLGHHLFEMLDKSRQLMRGSVVVWGVALGLLAWGAEGWGFVLTVDWLGIPTESSIGLFVGIYALSMLAGALSFLPGGLGSAEAAMGGMLVLLGVPLPVAVVATLICRLATLWFAIGLGLLAMLVLQGVSDWNVLAASDGEAMPAKAAAGESK